jgi:alanyl-tRNA synthetase
MRHIHLLGKQDNIMHLLVESLVQEMGQAFPELVNAKSIMEETLFMEEKRFKETLDRGLFLLENEIKFIPDGGTLPGEIAFKLYDTFGFPLDLTQDALRDKGYKVDTNGFTSAMNSQKEKARAAWVGSGDKQDSIIWFQYAKKFQQTEFLGYETPVAQGKVLAVLVDGVQSSVAIKGQKANVIFNQTPFYAESGGQVSDTGSFRSESGHGLVSQVMKKEGFFVHSIEVLDGTLELETGVELKVDELLRNSISSNHSATHLMHESLRGILGDHVAQRGSLNDSKRIRFDFSHGKPLTQIELEEVESQVNAYIRQNTSVSTRSMTPDEARELGARALFGEKYGDEVRVVSMGVKSNSGLGVAGNTFSLELCGGTHVKRTGDIGSFKIVSETASASGVRRIEGCTGEQVAKLVFHQERTLRNVSKLLKTNGNDIIYRLEALFEDKKNLQLQISNMKKKLALRSEISGSKYAEKIKISNVSFVSKILHDVENNNLREIIDTQKKEIISGIILLINISSSKVNLICGITHDLTSQFSAVDIVKEASKATGGKGGGGRPDMAQAGGLDPNKASEAIEAAKVFILSQT